MLKFVIHNIFRNDSILNAFYEYAYLYKTPGNFNYFFNFGFLSLVCLVMQIITGLILSMHYVADWEYAFASVEHIMRDVNYGCFVRYLHANGASMFFFVVYIHIFKNLYYGSFMYPRRWVWVTGVFIFILMILTAFTGYVLPWGQMSFWAATVITNLCSAIPYVGVDLVQWIWGGYSVDNPTLKRFYTIHFLMPFVILALAMLHITLLHHWGSNSPLGIGAKLDNRRFTPYFFIKDFSYLFFFALFAGYFIFFAPNVLGHPDNYIPANPLVTPEHIVPEWYFLPFYAILRALPDKLLGVCALGMSLIVLLFLPFYDRASVRSFYFKPISKIFFWWFVSVCMLLMWTGAKPIESPFLLIGQISTFGYFAYLLIVIPLFSELHLIFNKFRLFYPFNMEGHLNTLLSKSFLWLFNVLSNNENPNQLNNHISQAAVSKEEIISTKRYYTLYNNVQFVSSEIDVNLLFDLDKLDINENVIDDALAKRILDEKDLEEYRRWENIVYYIGFFLRDNKREQAVKFISDGLEMPLTDKEYEVISQQKIDINLYKVAKYYRIYRETNLSLLQKNYTFVPNEQQQQVSVWVDVSLIAFFLFEEIQEKFFFIPESTFADVWLEKTVGFFKKLYFNSGN